MRTVKQHTSEITITTAAARAKLGYNALLGRILRGQIAGRQTDSGRWLVDEKSLDRYIAEQVSSNKSTMAAVP